MATVSSLATFTALGTSLKSYLGISGSAEDSMLTLWLGAAASAADLYLDGTSFNTLPADVQLALFMAVQVWRSRSASDGLRSARTKDLQEDYASAYISDAALGMMRPLLRPYKTHRCLDGGRGA
jgi:hypothetical protein